MRPPAMLASVGLMLASHAAKAQTATLSGTVTRDSAGHPFAQAEVWIPQLAKRAIANVFGDYRITQLPEGAYIVIVRAIGFAPIQDSIVLVSDKTTERDFILSQRVQLLDSVVSASRRRTPGEWWREDFDFRRKTGIGHFITTEELRNHDNDNLGTILREKPGVQLVTNGTAILLSSARNPSGPPPPPGVRGRGGPPPGCWASVYLDGIPIYKTGDRGGPPDLSRFDGRDFAAAEYYVGAAQTPPQYSGPKSGCGVLLLWTRIK